MRKNTFVYIISLLCLSIIFSCSEKEEEQEEVFAKNLFDIEKLILESTSNEVSLKINNVAATFVFSRVFYDQKIDSVTLHEFKTNNDTIKGKWFTIFKKNNHLHINTEKNNTNENRKFTVSYFLGQRLEGLYIIQKGKE